MIPKHFIIQRLEEELLREFPYKAKCKYLGYATDDDLTTREAELTTEEYWERNVMFILLVLEAEDSL